MTAKAATALLLGVTLLAGTSLGCVSDPYGQPVVTQNQTLGAVAGGLAGAAIANKAGSRRLAVVQGSPREGAVTIRQRDSFWNVLPIAVALGLLLMLGVWIPAPLSALLDRAAAMVEVAR